MKLCKDCVHSQRKKIGDHMQWLCDRPIGDDTSMFLVTGEVRKRTKGAWCVDERQGACGLDGYFWEPSWWGLFKTILRGK